MIDKNNLQALLDFGRENGLPWVEIEGIKIPVVPKIEPMPEVSDATMKANYSPEPEYTEEELLYFATPYFDELQEMKKNKEELKEQAEDLNG